MIYKAKKWYIYLRLYMLAAMAIGCFVLDVGLFEIPRITGAALFNVGVDLLGLFVCVALYFGCIDERKIDAAGSAYWLMALIFQIGLSFCNNTLCWCIAGVAKFRTLYLILNEVTKIYDFALVMLFYNYVRRTLDFTGPLAEWLDKYIFVLIAPFAILVVANTFVPINFMVDEQGVFHTLPLYRLVDLYMVIIAPMAIILLLRCSASRRQKMAAFSFILTPIIHYILTRGAHGYATQYGSTLFAVTQIYGILFSDQNKKLATTQADLATAWKIQDSMLPNDFPAFPERGEFEIFALMDPAREVGGDFYDFFLVDDDHLGIVMADVSGKGIPGAMFMMVSKIILKSRAMMGMSPAEALSETNEAICANNKEDMFVTIWFGVLEIPTGKITASNAGHEYPVFKKHDGDYELIKDKHGLVIGAYDTSVYSEYEMQMEPGDKLFLYTDGVPESTNSALKQYGTDRLVAALNEVKDGDPALTLQHVMVSIDAFVKEAEQFDDVTMLCLQYNGKKED